METNFKGTRGKVKKHLKYDKKYKQPVINIAVGNCDCVLTIWTGLNKGQEIRKEELADAQLIVDAFKIRQQINCDLPELLEQRNKAVELLQKLTNDATFLEDARQFLKTL